MYNLDFRLLPRRRRHLCSSGFIMQRRVVIPYRRFGTTYRPNLQVSNNLGSTATHSVTFQKRADLVCMIMFIRNRLLCSDCNVYRHQIEHWASFSYQQYRWKDCQSLHKMLSCVKISYILLTCDGWWLIDMPKHVAHWEQFFFSLSLSPLISRVQGIL